MTARRAALAAFLAATALVAGDADVAAAKDDRPAFQRGPDFQKRVDAAIARGVAWLKSAQRGDGGYPDEPDHRAGVTALAYHALRSSRVPVGDATAASVYRALQSAYVSMGAAKKDTALTTYVASLMCVAAADHAGPRDAAAAPAAGDKDVAWTKELVQFLAENQDAGGMWKYGPQHQWTPTRPDNSNTQFAVLGLKSATGLGVRAPIDVWRRSLKHFIDTPARRTGPGGGYGWAYPDVGGGFEDAMTAGGIGAVVMCRSELVGEPSYRDDRDAQSALREAVRCLGKAFDDRSIFDLDAAKQSGWSMQRYYLAYAVERAGALSGLDEIGGHDWYGEGAEFLVGMQSRNGAWIAGVPPGRTEAPAEKPNAADTVVSTCFALLFLGRATPPAPRGALTKSMDDDVNFGVAETLGEKDFGDFLDLVLSRWRRSADGAAKERLFAKATAVGPRILAPLIARLSSPKDDERAAASALLARATGLDLGPDPAAWRTWLSANERALGYDDAAGRIVVGGAKPEPKEHFGKRVDAAVAKGVAWLRSVQGKDGAFPSDGASWSVGTALAFQAFRACKVPADDPTAVAAFAGMRQAYEAHRPRSAEELSTNDAAACCMALAEHGAPGPIGELTGERTTTLEAADAAWMAELAAFLEEMRRPEGSFAPDRARLAGDDADAGETYLALLGLKAASRAGVAVKPEIWRAAMHRFLDVQAPDGAEVVRPIGESGTDRARGFGAPREKAGALDVSPWNTAAGVAALIVCRGELTPDPKKRGEFDAVAERSIRDGLAWLSLRFDRASTNGVDEFDCRVLCAVERVCGLAGVERIGFHDWYDRGAERLLSLQDASGAWSPGRPKEGGKPAAAGEVVEATCRALLFLARRTPHGGNGALKRPFDDSDIDFAAAPSLGDKEFEAFVDLVLARRKLVEDAAVKERLFAKATAVGPRIVPALIRRLTSPTNEIRVAAFTLLKRATGLVNGYALNDPPGAREAAAAAWQAWWTANEKTLHYDPARGLLIP